MIVKTDIATVIAVFTALPDCCALQYRFENDTSSVEGEPGRPLGILECNEIVTASLDGCVGRTSQVSDVECASAALWAIPCVSARTAMIFCTITLQTLCRLLIVHTPKRPLDLAHTFTKEKICISTSLLWLCSWRTPRSSQTDHTLHTRLAY